METGGGGGGLCDAEAPRRDPEVETGGGVSAAGAPGPLDNGSRQMVVVVLVVVVWVVEFPVL